jgi:DNA-binding transcriptional LysR family regulator
VDRGDRGPGIDLRRLRYFVAVAEELHFGRAAARLHMSAPPLSQRIRELEAQLGLVLFERTSRRVALTPAGERLLVEARQVLAAVEGLSATAAELASAPATWTVAYCHGSEGGMMRTVRAFRSWHPDVVVRPDGLTSLLILDGLRAGRLAVGILRGPLPEPAGGLTSEPLARVPVDHVAVPPDHPLADRSVVSAADLDGEPVLVVERSEAPTAHEGIVAYCTSLGVHPRWVPHAPVQVERELDLVALGSGVAWLNAWQAGDAARRDDVVVRPLAPVGLYDDFRVAWRVGDVSPLTAAFVRLARETCGA